MHKASIPLALSALLAATSCTHEDGRTAASKAAPIQADDSATKVAEAAKPASMSAEEAAAALPGFPVQDLPAFVRNELVTAARDEFVYDGKPYTLAGCLEKEELGCKAHAIRGLHLIATLLKMGASRPEALTAYNRYYRSFEPAQRETIAHEDSPCRGPENAKHTLIEFSDFECPHCAAARPTLEKIVSERDDIRFCFMNFPLPGHSNASSAAQAGVFAQRHGKFWELHDKIFENQRRLSVSVIKALVAQVGLDPKELVAAVKKDELSPIVEKQKAEGLRLGIDGTPSIYLDGRKLELPLSPELLRFTIEDEIEWTTNGNKWSP